MHPHELHYTHLKGIATCLRRTRKWGLRYKLDLSTGPPSIHLPDGDFSDVPMPPPLELPPFPMLPSGPIIVCFCDAACGNVKNKRKSRLDVVFTLPEAQLYIDLKHKHKQHSVQQKPNSTPPSLPQKLFVVCGLHSKIYISHNMNLLSCMKIMHPLKRLWTQLHQRNNPGTFPSRTLQLWIGKPKDLHQCPLFLEN